MHLRGTAPFFLAVYHKKTGVVEQERISEVLGWNRAFTWSGWGLLFVMLFMPLHGAVVAQHHLPQGLTQVRQAGYVAVQGDMLTTE